MDIGVRVFEDLNCGNTPVEIAELPSHIVVALRSITDRRSNIAVGRSFFSWHCWKRMYTLTYSPGGIGTIGFRVTELKVCEVCGKVNKKSWEDLSGVPI